jgi:hypothetical protein
MTYEDFTQYSREFVENGTTSLNSLSSGAQSIAAEASEYTRKSAEAGQDFIEALFSAKSIEDAVDIQAGYFKATYETFVAEAGKFSALYADLAKSAYKPFESFVATPGAATAD